MVLAMCPPDNCACSEDQEPAAIGQEQADRHIPDDAQCPHFNSPPIAFSTTLRAIATKSLPLPEREGICPSCHGKPRSALAVEIELTYYRRSRLSSRAQLGRFLTSAC